MFHWVTMSQKNFFYLFSIRDPVTVQQQLLFLSIALLVFRFPLLVFLRICHSSHLYLRFFLLMSGFLKNKIKMSWGKWINPKETWLSRGRGVFYVHTCTWHTFMKQKEKTCDKSNFNLQSLQDISWTAKNLELSLIGLFLAIKFFILGQNKSA